MKDAGDPRMIEFLRANNDHVEEALGAARELRRRIHAELLALVPPDEGPEGFLADGHWYRLRYRPGSEYPEFVRRRGSVQGPEEILLDLNALARGHENYLCEGLRLSPGGRWLAFAEDVTGDRSFTLRIKDTESASMLGDVIPFADSSAAWSCGGRSLLYTALKPGTLQPYRVLRHVLGTSLDEDELLYEEKDEGFRCLLIPGRSGRFILLNCYSNTAEETFILPSDDPAARFESLCPRSAGHIYEVDEDGEGLLIRSDRTSPDFGLFEAPAVPVEPGRWREVVLPGEGRYLDQAVAFRDYAALTGFMEGLRRLWILDRRTGETHEVEFPDRVCHAWIDANPSVEARVVRVGFTSLRTPVTFYDYDMERRDLVMLRREEVPGFSPEELVTERTWARARDGAKVPLSLVRRRDALEAGPAPLLLFGYGAYGTCIPLYFDQSRLALLKRGFVYGMAHLRGGSELGAGWHEQGRLLSKMNSVNDFIDCAEHLVLTGVAKRGQLFAESLSAGGLVLGAVANLRPDLFRGMCLLMPFVDPVGVLSDESLPLSSFEKDEFGDPLEPLQREVMRSYSPHDNVTRQAYPDMLVFTAENDSQVRCWEPARWVSRLRENDTGGARILLKTRQGAGHGGASGRLERLEDLALQYAFILDLAGRA